MLAYGPRPWTKVPDQGPDRRTEIGPNGRCPFIDCRALSAKECVAQMSSPQVQDRHRPCPAALQRLHVLVLTGRDTN